MYVGGAQPEGRGPTEGQSEREAAAKHRVFYETSELQQFCDPQSNKQVSSTKPDAGQIQKKVQPEPEPAAQRGHGGQLSCAPVARYSW